MLEYIKSDLYRYEGRVTLFLFIRNFFFNPSFKFTTFMRLCNSSNKLLAKISRLFHYHYGIKYSLKIHPSTQIGYGFYIAHGTSIVVNPSAIIGNNVSLSQFTSIGASKGVAATIGDEVYVGPNVSIVENVTIGRGASIGAGAVVISDIPEEATAVGVPAKVIHSNNASSYIVYKWDVKL